MNSENNEKSTKKKFWGIIYKITDDTDGSFYTGLTTQKEKWNKGRYWGSGSAWKQHMEQYPGHHYSRKILVQAKNFEELRAKEKEINNAMINKYPLLCFNIATHKQGTFPIETGKKCTECGGWYGHHKGTCSHFTPSKPCKECGAKRGHYKNCSQYNSSTVCSECGGKRGSHYKNCSHYSQPKACKECGGTFKHKKTCSKYISSNPCPECGAIVGHKGSCSKVIICKECGGKGGKHKKGCPKYTEWVCRECGGKNGQHIKGCSKYKERGNICKECKGKGGKHKKSCSKYISRVPCSECGAVIGHKSFCSKVIICKECGGKNGAHRLTCSRYTYEAKKVLCITNNVLYTSARSAAKILFKTNKRTVIDAIRHAANPNNSLKSYKGYKFVYIEK